MSSCFRNYTLKIVCKNNMNNILTTYFSSILKPYALKRQSYENIEYNVQIFNV